MQTTLRSAVSFTGTGLHSGARARLTLRPAGEGHGIWFRRTDLARGDRLIPARWDAVVPARLCTRLANAAGADVSTVEHVMAALAGCGVTNALVDVDGPEVPILDGSAAPFVKGILARGLRALDVPSVVIRVLEPVEVQDGAAVARLDPAEAFEMHFAIDFADAAIGRQERRITLANGAFVRDLSDSRTFCRVEDVAAMQASGLAPGGTYDNAVLVDGDRVLTPGGLRHADEPVRHKMLDAVGDLALAGAPLLARYTGLRAGHALTNRLLRALFARPTAFRLLPCPPETERRLPGHGLVAADLPLFA